MPNTLSSATNDTAVPFLSATPLSLVSEISSPAAKRTVRASPSRTLRIVNALESAFTALMPTPFSPTDFLNAFESYLAPVFIFEATSTSLPSGMPRP